jgi:hypothetical protein
MNIIEIKNIFINTVRRKDMGFCQINDSLLTTKL